MNIEEEIKLIFNSFIEKNKNPQEYYFFISEQQIKNNWKKIMNDPDNPHPEIDNAKEWIDLAKTGTMKILGATVIIIEGIQK